MPSPRAAAVPDAMLAALPPAHFDSIARSHERCASIGLARIAHPAHEPMGRADLGVLRERHHGLHSHAAPVMEMLYGQIVDTESMVVLCDATGTLIHSIGDDDFLARAAKVALQPGVNWSESSKGTNAIGTALIDERPTLVHGGEHYLHANEFLTCSAAPILDPRGQIVGALDVTGDRRSYHQHTMALVKMSVRMIENRWLDHEFRESLRLRLHSRAELIGTLTEGVLALTPEGRIVGANRGALELLGLSGAALRHQDVETLFGRPLGALADAQRDASAIPLVANATAGRPLALHGRLEGPLWRRGVGMPSAPSLAALEVQAMRRAVDDAGGNIAQAARRLGVSRSTIYRKLRWRATS